MSISLIVPNAVYCETLHPQVCEACSSFKIRKFPRRPWDVWQQPFVCVFSCVANQDSLWLPYSNNLIDLPSNYVTITFRLCTLRSENKLHMTINVYVHTTISTSMAVPHNGKNHILVQNTNDSLFLYCLCSILTKSYLVGPHTVCFQLCTPSTYIWVCPWTQHSYLSNQHQRE